MDVNRANKEANHKKNECKKEKVDEVDKIKIQRLSGRFYANYYSILPKAGTFNIVSFE